MHVGDPDAVQAKLREPAFTDPDGHPVVLCRRD